MCDMAAQKVVALWSSGKASEAIAQLTTMQDEVLISQVLTAIVKQNNGLDENSWLTHSNALVLLSILLRLLKSQTDE